MDKQKIVLKVSQELEAWISQQEEDEESCISEGWIKNVKFDSEKVVISFTANIHVEIEDWRQVQLQVPLETFPKGKYIMRCEDMVKNFLEKSVIDALDSAVIALEEVRFSDIRTPTTADQSSKVKDNIFGDDDLITPLHSAAPDFNLQLLQQDLNALKNTKGWDYELGAHSSESTRIYYFIDPKQRIGVSSIVAAAWGLDLSKYITIVLTFGRNVMEAVVPPQIDVYQSGNVNDQNVQKLSNKAKFGYGWSLQTRLREDFFKKHTPLMLYEDPDKNFMEAMLEMAENLIKNSPSNCVICGDKMSIVGLKPTVCEKTACIFSYEHFGVGLDLEVVVREETELVDLMITFCFAAAEAPTGEYNHFDPYPSALESKTKNAKTGEFEPFTFMSKDGQKREAYKVVQVLDTLPSVKDLKLWAEQGKLKENLDKAHPAAYSLLRWIMATNRSHLKKLSPEEQIPQMVTPHQFLLISTPPEKEKSFQALKSQHGSLHAFHGSALMNWHAIMRTGLKNLSGTSGQKNGAVYGNGVYLAADSSTSFGYVGYQKIWPKSMFANAANAAANNNNNNQMGCIALCEIINDPVVLKGQPNPYYVIPKEELIQTRYFFIYAGQNDSKPAVQNTAIVPPVIKWA